MTELLALVQNSRPAPTALRTTGAGIKKLNTFAQLAVVREVRLNGFSKEPLQPRVELIFKEVERRGIELQSLLKEPSNAASRVSIRSLSPCIATDERNPSITALSITRIRPDTLYG